MGAADLIKAECVRRLDEGEARIRKCLGLLSEAQVWVRPNAQVTSVGNLMLHLNGNVGQWLVSTLGGVPDRRERDLEFEPASAIPVGDLLGRLGGTLAAARQVISGLDEPDLLRTYGVQGYSETGIAILVHVVEHFSYHTGQITLHTKLMLEVDTGYYEGDDLNARS